MTRELRFGAYDAVVVGAEPDMAWVLTYGPLRLLAVDLTTGTVRRSLEAELFPDAARCGPLWVLSAREQWIGYDAGTLDERWRGTGGAPSWRFAGSTPREILFRTPEGVRRVDAGTGALGPPFTEARGPFSVASTRDGFVLTDEEGSVGWVGPTCERRWKRPRPPSADAVLPAFGLDGQTWLAWHEEAREGPETVLQAIDDATGEPNAEHRVPGALRQIAPASGFAVAVSRDSDGYRAVAWSSGEGLVPGERVEPTAATAAAGTLGAVASEGTTVVAVSAGGLRWTRLAWPRPLGLQLAGDLLVGVGDGPTLRWIAVAEAVPITPDAIERAWRAASPAVPGRCLPNLAARARARGLELPDALARFVGTWDESARFRTRLDRLGWTAAAGGGANPMTGADVSPALLMFAASERDEVYALADAGDRFVYAISGADGRVTYAGASFEEFLGRALVDTNVRRPSLVKRVLEDLGLTVARTAVRTPPPSGFPS